MVDDQHSSAPTPPGRLARREDLEALLAEARDVAYHEASRRLGAGLAGRELPSDLAQSVVREMLEDIGQLEYRGAEAFRGLVKTILIAKIGEKLRFHRAQKRDARIERELPPAAESGAVSIEPPAREPGPLTAAGDRELLALGSAAMRFLSERERRVVEMKAAGSTHREIADALGVSVENSERILSDARKKLRGD